MNTKEYIIRFSRSQWSILKRLVSEDRMRWEAQVREWKDNKDSILRAGMEPERYEAHLVDLQAFADSRFDLEKHMLDDVLTYKVNNNKAEFRVAVSK